MQRGSVVFDYGNNLRGEAYNNCFKSAFEIPGFVPEYIRPLFCEGKGPFRWVALSGDPEDIYRTDEAIMKAFPENKLLHKWLKAAKEKVHFQGLPARICWLGYGEQSEEQEKYLMIWSGTELLSAPIVIGRDHLDCGSVASPNRETEKMKDGSDAIADWPILNFGLALHRRSELGFASSRRRSRDWEFDSFGNGDCCRRNQRSRRKTGKMSDL